MKTTLDIDDRLLARAKQAAAAQGRTLRAFVEDALRGSLVATGTRRDGFKANLPVITGRGRPAVDIADRDALYDMLERE